MSNRLIHEKSPYLLQHAHNPVDWYPWTDQAFETAAQRDCPIFLSIGYATCHWCHVMERESFENEGVAALMNEAFVNIKVDREERPDVDALYMTVAQMLIGRAGWPLTVIMFPDRQPFFAGTYIPKESGYGRLGMVDLIPRIQLLWRDGRPRIQASATNIMEELARLEAHEPSVVQLDTAVLDQAFQALQAAFDSEHGGFGRAPKFPTPHQLLFLLRYWRRAGRVEAWNMVATTLDGMRCGGVFDHLGYGFHRYSTDAAWLLPHFEKMLYDQAMLMLAYTEAFVASGRAEEFAYVVREIAVYVLRDLVAPGGAFFCAEDADSEGEEGKFYVWTLEEMAAVLGDETAQAAELWNVKEHGNFRDEATGAETGANVLHLTPNRERRLPRRDERLERMRQRLFERRVTRVRPLLDDKILTDWNGLMIAALASAARALDADDLLGVAERAATFVWDTMWVGEEGGLLHRYRSGEAGINGHLDDYAFLAWGELELYHTTLELVHLERALKLTEAMLSRFWDEQRGGLFVSSMDRTDLLVRQREVYDGAIPSGNAVAFANLQRLFRLTGNARYERYASDIGRAFSQSVVSRPAGHTFLLTGLDFAIGPSQELVIVGSRSDADTLKLIDVARRAYRPNLVVLFRDADNAGPAVRVAPFVANMTPVDGRATAYLCTEFRCERPVTDPEDLSALLGSAEPVA